MRAKKRILFAALFSLAAAGRASTPPPADVDALVRLCQKAADGVTDYACLFHRKERIGKKLIEQRNIRAKVGNPYRVVLTWTEGKLKGTEVLYDPSAHGDKIKAHPGWIFSFITLTLSPDGSLAMRDNRHNIREFGIASIVKNLAAIVQKAKETGEGGMAYLGETALVDGPAWTYEGKFTDGKGFYAPHIVICFDEKTVLPVKLNVYDGKEELLEEYIFDHLRVNAGLTSADFELRRK